MPNLVTVEFRGDTLFAVEGADGVFVAVKPISDRLGLDWRGQKQRISRDPLLAEGMAMMAIPSPGGAQDTICLALRLINGWLFGIDVDRVKPELREDVLAYKRECYETLADRFLGPRAAGRPILAPETVEGHNLRAEEHKLNLVARMQAMKGPAYAFALYRRLGLPVVEPEAVDLPGPQDGSAARESVTLAAVADTLRTFLRGRAADLVPVVEAGDPRTWGKRGVVGFRAPDGDHLLPRGTWETLMQAHGPRPAAQVLALAGWLVRDPENRLAGVVRVGGKPRRVYRIRAGFLAYA